MSNELAVQSSLFIAALSENGVGGLTAEEIREEYGIDRPQYPRIKIPSGGGIAFEVPGDDPNNPEITKELIGVIAHHHSCNAYWIDGQSDENRPPDCFSPDGVTGIGSNASFCGGICAKCGLNEFDSGTGGRGKACKNTKRLYLLTGDSLLPCILSLPPTSLQGYTKYLTSLLTRGFKACDVLTRISLMKKESGGNVYSVAVFSRFGVLPEDVKAKSRQYREEIKAFVDMGFDGSTDPNEDYAGFSEVSDAEGPPY